MLINAARHGDVDNFNAEARKVSDAEVAFTILSIFSSDCYRRFSQNSSQHTIVYRARTDMPCDGLIYTAEGAQSSLESNHMLSPHHCVDLNLGDLRSSQQVATECSSGLCDILEEDGSDNMDVLAHGEKALLV